MNEIPNNPMPKTSSLEFHQEKMLSLNNLKEGWRDKGCKNDVANYVNWLYSKVASYEDSTIAYNKIIDGSKIRSIEEYASHTLSESARIRDELEQEIADRRYTMNQDISNRKNATDKELNISKRELEQIRNEIHSYQIILSSLEEKNLLESFGYYDYNNPAEESVRLKQDLDIVRMEIKEIQKSKQAISVTSNFVFNNSTKEGKKFSSDFSTLMLTAYNQEVENAIVKLDRTRSLDVAIGRIEKAKSRVARLGTLMDAFINDYYHQLRIQEVVLAFEFKDMEIARKDQEREERERLREEEKVRKESEKAAREASEEVEKKRQELNDLLSYQQQHYSNVVGQLKKNDPKIEALKVEIAKLEKAKQEATERLANTKAGYVYVISNIGSFGEGIVKIGLTRRLKPEDRVNELSNASVPFIFDTHAIHFSNNAVELERKLHQYFYNERVNKVNPRKEYFRVSLERVEKALEELTRGNDKDSTLMFTYEAIAADYRKSIGN